MLQEVLELYVAANRLRNAGEQRRRVVNIREMDNRQNKDQMKNDIVHALKTLAELKEEQEVLETAWRKQAELNQELAEKK